MSLNEVMSGGVKRKKINVKEIRVNTLNFYEKELIDSLALSILDKGQLLNAMVYAEYGEDGKKYTLIDGETRFLAICKLYKEGSHDGMFDVVIRPKPETELEIEELLMEANLQRTKSKEDRLCEIEKATKIYTKKKELGLIATGVKCRDWIGEKIGMSGRQVQSYLTGDNTVLVGVDEIGTPQVSNTTKEVSKVDIDKAVKRCYKMLEKASCLFVELGLEERERYTVYEDKVSVLLSELKETLGFSED